MRRGIVFQYKRYAIHDGPGIRTTVFMKGCPLSCSWCHNPEGISPRPQLLFNGNRCSGCGRCIKACATGALGPGPGNVSPSLCDICGECAEACPAGAMELAGEEVTSDEVMDILSRDLPFYANSGGGVTFSGGEPLLQVGFLEELLARCSEAGIHTAVDTSCYSTPEDLLRVAELADLIMCDIKLVEEDAMLHYTGVGPEPVLKNIRMLSEGRSNFIVRMPIVPGITDTERNMLGVRDFLVSLPRRPFLELLPYHSAWKQKFPRLGMEPPAEMPEGEGDIKRAEEFFIESGLSCH